MLILILYVLVHIRYYIREMLDNNISSSTSSLSTKSESYSSLAAAFTFKMTSLCDFSAWWLSRRLHILTVPSLAFIVCLRLKDLHRNPTRRLTCRASKPYYFLIYGGIWWSIGAGPTTRLPAQIGRSFMYLKSLLGSYLYQSRLSPSSLHKN